VEGGEVVDVTGVVGKDLGLGGLDGRHFVVGRLSDGNR
jgi:hypothetical protein